MKTAYLIFPHQLYKDISDIPTDATIFLIEEFLFFRQYKFHKQKLAFHRASMKAYEVFLVQKGRKCQYVESSNPESDVRKLIPQLASEAVERIQYHQVTDDWLDQRIRKTATRHNMEIQRDPTQLFINSPTELTEYFKDRKSYFQTDFYIHQRKTRNILVTKAGDPLHEKWSFDADNRLKYPRNKTVPPLPKIRNTPHHQEARAYVDEHFGNHYGNLSDDIIYPVTFLQAEHWLDDFLQTRFADFGRYEDAIVAQEHTLHHSMLSPLLNAGLLLPGDVLDKAIAYAEKHSIAFNNLEGFVRQILGWREFIRALYAREGRKQRTKNHWKFSRKIPKSFYDATTGIEPIDQTIRKLLDTAYTHHIERLMVLSNFMFLCEFDPDDVYQWFMEMYIDAYDWVMVPNIYGMGQFADGGLMMTKPYISSSNYILKMSDYSGKGEWTEIWDALFWRFMDKHRDFFLKNPRLGMLVKTFDKMEADKRGKLLKMAKAFLESL